MSISSARAAQPALVSFGLSGSRFAAPLDSVREVVRFRELKPIPGMSAPLAGLLELRGLALPVTDLRGCREGGDVLVIDAGDGDVRGLAVDGVHSVLTAADCRPGHLPTGLPSYVTGVCHDSQGQLLLVDLVQMLAGAKPAQT